MTTAVSISEMKAIDAIRMAFAVGENSLLSLVEDMQNDPLYCRAPKERPCCLSPFTRCSTRDNCPTSAASSGAHPSSCKSSLE